MGTVVIRVVVVNMVVGVNVVVSGIVVVGSPGSSVGLTKMIKATTRIKINNIHGVDIFLFFPHFFFFTIQYFTSKNKNLSDLNCHQTVTLK